MRHLVKSTALVLALTTSSLLAQSPADDAILGALRIGSLDDLAGAAGKFANNVRPGSGAATAQLTGGATAFGIDTTAEILVLVLDPQTAALPVSFVLPVVDPEALKANPALGFKPADRADRYLITLGGRRMFATFVGKRLVVSPLEAGLDAVLPVVESGEDIRRLRATGGHLALSLSTDRLYSAYKPMLDGMLGGMRAQFAKAAPATGAQTVNPVDIYASFLGSVADLQTVSLRISIQPEHLDIRSLVQAKPGSSTAALLNPGRGPAVTTLGLHDPACAVLGTLSARPGPEFWQAYNDLTAKLLSSIGNTSDDSAASGQAMAKALNDFAAIWDGTASFGMFSTGKIMSGSGAVGITDQARALALIQSLPELQKSMSQINAAQGLVSEATFGAEETYHGARLIDVTQTHRAIDPAMDEGLKALQKLGLDRMTATYAVTADQLLYTMGDDSRADAKRLVDTTSPAPAAVTPAAYDLPAHSTLFATISLPRYAAWMGQVANLPVKAPPVAADTKPGLALSADLDAGRGDFRMRLSAADISTVIRMFSPAPPPAAAPTAPAE